jgi:hypothetical protein
MMGQRMLGFRTMGAKRHEGFCMGHATWRARA